VGFETTIAVFERAKTVHALDCAAIVIGFAVYLVLVKHTHSSTHYQGTQLRASLQINMLQNQGSWGNCACNTHTKDNKCLHILSFNTLEHVGVDGTIKMYIKISRL
jgi:hypothetical protein